MEYLFTLLGFATLIYAIRTFRQQKLEIIKGARITTLIHTSNMLQEQIDQHQLLVEQMKYNKQPEQEWQEVAERISQEFQPLKYRVNAELLELMARYDGVVAVADIRQALEPRK